MTKRRGGLGRGLGALIPEVPPQLEDMPVVRVEASPSLPTPHVQAETPPIPGPLQVPVDSIERNPHQPRQAIREEELEELAYSIREHGVLQPLIVTHVDGHYRLVAGERRWRAARLAGLDAVPVVVKEASSREMLEMALVENLQRADLNALEEAQAYRSLVEEFGLKQEDVAKRVGKSRQAVTNSLRLLRLPPAVQEALAQGSITGGHARAILQAPTEEAQVQLLRLIVEKGLNVRQAEALARRMTEVAEAEGAEKPEPEDPPLYDEMRALEENFRQALGTKVQLSRSSREGKLVIYFYSDEQLQDIYSSIVGEQ